MEDHKLEREELLKEMNKENAAKTSHMTVEEYEQYNAEADISFKQYLHDTETMEEVHHENVYVIESRLKDTEIKERIYGIIKDNFEQGINITKEKYQKIEINLNEGWGIDDALSFGENVKEAIDIYTNYSNEFPEKVFRIVKANCIYNGHGISNIDYDYERLEVLPDLEQVAEISDAGADVKVRIYNSESNLLKNGSVYSLDEANALYEQATKQVQERKQSSVVNKLKEVFIPAYDKIKATIELPKGDILGFRYDAGDGYSKNLIDFLDKDFANNPISEYTKDVLCIGDIILDKNDKCKVISNIHDGKFECFNVTNNTGSITDIKIESDPSNKIIKASTMYKLNKSEMNYRIGHIKNSALNKVLQKIDVFKAKNLVQVSNNSSEINQTNKLTNSLEL